METCPAALRPCSVFMGEKLRGWEHSDQLWMALIKSDPALKIPGSPRQALTPGATQHGVIHCVWHIRIWAQETFWSSIDRLERKKKGTFEFLRICVPQNWQASFSKLSCQQMCDLCPSVKELSSKWHQPQKLSEETSLNWGSILRPLQRPMDTLTNRANKGHVKVILQSDNQGNQRG
jgi:hypothetical protein